MGNIYNPLVSIVIPVYNGSEYLSASISSAVSQTYRNIEIIVVNDGSSDGGLSRLAAKEFKDKIRYYEKANGGVASALNLAINKMHGEWLSWLSHDDIYSPYKIEKQIDMINQLKELRPSLNEQNLILYGNMEQIDECGKKISAPKLDLSEGLSNADLILRNIKRNQFGGCTFLLPKRCFSNVGEFNTNLRTICDFEMWYRLLLADYEFHYIHEILVSNRMHKKQLTHTMAEKCRCEYYAFHEWLIGSVNKNDKYRSSGVFYALGRYMQRKHIPAAGSAFELAVGMSQTPFLLKNKIFLSKLIDSAYYIIIRELKKLFIAMSIKNNNR